MEPLGAFAAARGWYLTPVGPTTHLSPYARKRVILTPLPSIAPLPFNKMNDCIRFEEILIVLEAEGLKINTAGATGVVLPLPKSQACVPVLLR